MIDTCVHHRWVAEAAVHPYLEEGWRHYVGEPGSVARNYGARRLVPLTRYANPLGDDLDVARGADGSPPGSSYERLEEQLLRRNGVERALLLFDRQMFASSHPNPFFATATVSAINDWNIDQWLSRDDRLYGTALIPDQTPEDAVAELHRIGSHPKIAAVTLSPTLGRLLGHPIYNPIYKAASELGLPIVLHRGIDTMTDSPSGTAGGAPYTFAEYQTLAPLALTSNITSLVVNGVFARFPDLRVFVVGGGMMWVDSMLLRIDTLWRSLRRDFPWVHEAPREYFKRQVRISTYGLERTRPEVLARLFEGNPEYREFTCYGSCYPSWDTGWPEDVEALFPAEWHQDVLHDNADAWFRWGPRAAPASAGAEVATA
jgi:predicted TIM-barrel fold metal-dependent hydrolase